MPGCACRFVEHSGNLLKNDLRIDIGVKDAGDRNQGGNHINNTVDTSLIQLSRKIKNLPRNILVAMIGQANGNCPVPLHGYSGIHCLQFAPLSGQFNWTSSECLLTDALDTNTFSARIWCLRSTAPRCSGQYLLIDILRFALQ